MTLEKVIEIWSSDRFRDCMLPGAGSMTCGELAEQISGTDYGKLLTSWAECRALLSAERKKVQELQAFQREANTHSRISE